MLVAAGSPRIPANTYPNWTVRGCSCRVRRCAHETVAPVHHLIGPGDTRQQADWELDTEAALAGCSVNDVGKLNQSGRGWLSAAVLTEQSLVPNAPVTTAHPGINTTTLQFGDTETAPAQYFPIDGVLFSAQV